jgi:NTE family protein
MPLTTLDFTNLADPLIDAFKKQHGEPVVSDVLDKEGHQYVNLVQKGGGVLGVALVGYTYVLEKMGIRFMRLAGTSAGAINTALMAVTGNSKSEEKSTAVIKTISEMQFFSFVDGSFIVKKLITAVVRSENFGKRMGAIVKTIFILFLLLLIAAPVAYFLNCSCAHVLLICLSVYTALLIILGIYFASVMKRLKKTGFGLNPGDFFYDWIKKEMINNGVNNLSDLQRKAQTVPEFVLRNEVTHELGVTKLDADITFITAELSTQNKIELPKMIGLFRLPGDENSIHPAGYVRASMSIPVFFESYYIDKIPCEDPLIKEKWLALNEPNPPSVARFVDGGMLSNFPMSIFFKANVRTPRLPSFGIDLDDSDPADKLKNPKEWSFGGYARNMFNTIRDYYDKDFLLKNKMFEKGVGKVPVRGYNWLNFFLSDKHKLELFLAGANAACKFLETFKWDEYKGDREKYYDQLKQQE